MFTCVHWFHLCSLVFYLCSLVFHVCSLVFTCAPLVFICVLLVFICVHLCYTCFHSCSFVFHLCGVLDKIVSNTNTDLSNLSNRVRWSLRSSDAFNTISHLLGKAYGSRPIVSGQIIFASLCYQLTTFHSTSFLSIFSHI